MPIEVTARHMNPSDELQAYAREKAEALTELFPRVEHVHVILDHQHVAEVVVQGKQHIRVESREVSDNMRVSIDMAMAHVEKQLRRFHEKVQDHRIH
jgi:putative sigma-54 modulation protein